jgi:hypothetical protein
MSPTKSPHAQGFDDATDAARAVIRASIHALATRPCSSPHHRRLMLEAMQAIYIEIEGLRTDAPDPRAKDDHEPHPVAV